MRLRTFTAESLPAAFALVKAELGEDAIILSTTEKKDEVQVTAAIDPDDSSPRRGEAGRGASTVQQRKPAPLLTSPLRGEEVRYDVQHLLRFHNVPELFIAKMNAMLSDATVAGILGKGRMNIANESRHFLKLALEHVCQHYFTFVPLNREYNKLMIVGMPGIGKTLTIAKLATRYTLAGRKVVAITTDMNRAGGPEQLKSFMDILGVPLTICPDKKALASALKLIGRDTIALVDTAGCNPYIESELKDLSGLASMPGMEIALAMQAGMDTQEAIDIAECFTTFPLSSLIATRTDCTRRMGGLLAAAAAHRLPLSVAGDSASVADNITELDAKTLVQYLLKPL